MGWRVNSTIDNAVVSSNGAAFTVCGSKVLGGLTADGGASPAAASRSQMWPHGRITVGQRPRDFRVEYTGAPSTGLQLPSTLGRMSHRTPNELLSLTSCRRPRRAAAFAPRL